MKKALQVTLIIGILVVFALGLLLGFLYYKEWRNNFESEVPSSIELKTIKVTAKVKEVFENKIIIEKAGEIFDIKITKNTSLYSMRYKIFVDEDGVLVSVEPERKYMDMQDIVVGREIRAVIKVFKNNNLVAESLTMVFPSSKPEVVKTEDNN